MRSSMRLAVVPLLFLGPCTAAFGQASRPGTGSVTGHVLCQDTQKPARLAGVTLYAVPQYGTPPARRTDADYTQLSSQASMDGSFVINNVPPGDYYAYAFVSGYMPPGRFIEAAVDAGADLAKGIPGLTTVQVSADRTVEADITLERGAAVEGRVLWDDGTPVSFIPVTVISTTKSRRQVPPGLGMLMAAGSWGGLMSYTDDRGHYRITGLPPGEHLVVAELQLLHQMVVLGGSVETMTTSTPVAVFAPAAFRKGDARAIKLDSGEDRQDEDITVNASGAHSITGRVASAEDHHMLNSGGVELQDPSDASFGRKASIDDQGNFTLPFVPPGTYTIAVTSAADIAPKPDKTGGRGSTATLGTYAGAKQTVIVTDSDVTGVNFELAPGKSAASGNAGDPAGSSN